MRPNDYVVEDRPIDDVPSRAGTHKLSPFWREMYARLEVLTPDRSLFFGLADRDVADVRRALRRSRDTLSNQIRKRYPGRFLMESDSEALGVFVYVDPKWLAEHGESVQEPAPEPLRETESATAKSLETESPAAPPVPDPPATNEAEDQEPDPEPQCGCPSWWKNSLAWKPDRAALRGPHHHDGCELFDKEPADGPADVCTCDPWHRANTPKFNIDVASEAHEKDKCALYRQGAHFWPIPNGTDPKTHEYESTCPWCAETRTFYPWGEQKLPSGEESRDWYEDSKAKEQRWNAGELPRKRCVDCGRETSGATPRCRSHGIRFAKKSRNRGA